MTENHDIYQLHLVTTKNVSISQKSQIRFYCQLDHSVRVSEIKNFPENPVASFYPLSSLRLLRQHRIETWYKEITDRAG